MKKFLFLLIGIFLPTGVHADNFILMIGDGMGANHLKCAAKDKPIYIPTLPVKGSVHTRSADAEITDSAASATAYSCGQKTNNNFIAKLPNGDDCQTIAEKAIQKGLSVGIYSTDYSTSATSVAFFAHALHRYDPETIEKYRQEASAVMDIAVPVEKLSDEIIPRLESLSSQTDKKGFFALFEEAFIDAQSHENHIHEMKQELYDFDYAVMKAVNFVYKHPDTTVIVLADHETGGLTEEDCVYTTRDHTAADIPVYAYGKNASLFAGEQDNTEIHRKMETILFNEP
ncbi:MAG: alkaline phosphatase [Alphaproteobacteria bacterium]|nr:alkaline phosphatase [Alphaproteobacteria bacterium]